MLKKKKEVSEEIFFGPSKDFSMSFFHQGLFFLEMRCEQQDHFSLLQTFFL